MQKSASSKQSNSTLSAQQKVAFLLLMFLGVGGIVLGFRSFGTNLQRPFDLQIAEHAGETFLTSDEEEEIIKEEQKNQDTDQDGISDYDELYVFKTSPYLADTDSDGLNDYAEVYSGGDPSCPSGTDCTSGSESTGSTDPDVTDLFPGVENVEGGEEFADLDLTNPEDIMSFFQELTSSEMRAVLIDAGVPEEQLDQLDDETLKELFNEAVTATQTTEVLDVVE